jgi:uncharacterized protein YcfJ
MNRKITLALTLGLSLAAATASAHGIRYQSARVVAVEPVYNTVMVRKPVRTCHREYVERVVSERTYAGPTIAGAIVGAAIGRQFGDGYSRDALTVLGATAGAAVANDRAQRRRGSEAVIVQQPVERCTTSYRRAAERHLSGYIVDYRHRGRIYRTRMVERPGRFIRIAIGS